MQPWLPLRRPLVLVWVFLSSAAAGQVSTGLLTPMVENSNIFVDHVSWPHMAIVLEHKSDGEDYGGNTGVYLAASCVDGQRFYNREKRRVMFIYERWITHAESRTQWVIASSAGACKPFDEDFDQIYAVMDDGNDFSDPAIGWSVYTARGFDHYALRLGNDFFELTDQRLHGRPVYFDSTINAYVVWWPSHNCWTVQSRSDLGSPEWWNYARRSYGTEITTLWSTGEHGVFATPSSAESHLQALAADGPVKICSALHAGYCLLVAGNGAWGLFPVSLIHDPREWEEEKNWRGTQWNLAKSSNGGFAVTTALLHGTGAPLKASCLIDCSTFGQLNLQVETRTSRVNEWVFTPVRTGWNTVKYTIRAGFHPSAPPLSPYWDIVGVYLTAGSSPTDVHLARDFDEESAMWTVTPVVW